MTETGECSATGPLAELLIGQKIAHSGASQNDRRREVRVLLRGHILDNVDCSFENSEVCASGAGLQSSFTRLAASPTLLLISVWRSPMLDTSEPKYMKELTN